MNSGFVSSSLAVVVALVAGFPATPEDLRGMASLTCSGTLIRANRAADRPAILLTNGHCATNTAIEADDAITNAPYERGEISLYFGGEAPEGVKPSRVLYATRTGTDLALIELKSTYGELEAKGARVYELSDVDAKPETDIQLVSGYWKQKQLCAISHIVGSLIEDVWMTRDSYAMRDPCPIVGGWSGTPMLDPTTGKVVGILNTTNTAGQVCTVDNPCEVMADGTRLAFNGRAYGQRTTAVLGCIDPTGDLNLELPTCKLQKPKARPTPRPSPETTPTTRPDPKPSKPGSAWPKASRKRS